MGSNSNLLEWVVMEVTPHEDYSLSLLFADGKKKRVDMLPVINRGGVFEPLKNIAFFMVAHKEGSSVAWNDEIDIAPEYLYENGVEEV